MKPTLDLVRELAESWSKIPEVFIVDDDENYVFLFREILERNGVKVDIATDTDQAIDKVKFRSINDRPYDLAFLDLRIPPANGVTVLREIRQIMPETPVVIITGYPDSDMVSEAMQHGYLGIMKKPLNFGEIQEIFTIHKIKVQK